MDSAVNYDIIIAGAGCAGLSLLYRLLQEPELNQQRILLIDKQRKESNDRTWCFWEEYEGCFESIVRNCWDTIAVHTFDFHTTPSIAPYRYKMISGLDFYRHVMQLASRFPNVSFCYEKILKIKSLKKGLVRTITSANEYVSSLVFNSTFLYTKPSQHKCAMHFKGVRIRTEADSFDSSLPVFMDFRVSNPQQNGFMYVLPVTPREALLEYTVIGGRVLKSEEYLAEIDYYLREIAGLKHYEIAGEEAGVLPLSCRYFPRRYRRRIIHIGAAAGCVKPGSGYAFQFIQHQCDEVVRLMKTGRFPLLRRSLFAGRFRYYDATFLSVIQHSNPGLSNLIRQMFMQLPAPLILKFLENKTNWREELKIIRIFPSRRFVPAAFKSLFCK